MCSLTGLESGSHGSRWQKTSFQGESATPDWQTSTFLLCPHMALLCVQGELSDVSLMSDVASVLENLHISGTSFADVDLTDAILSLPSQ